MARDFNDHSENFSLEESFKKWLQTFFTSRAASDYPSRLRRFFREEYPKLNLPAIHNGKHIYSLFGALMAQGKDGKDLALSFLDLCIALSIEGKSEATSQSERNKFNDYTSALYAFQRFLLNLSYSLSWFGNRQKVNGCEDDGHAGNCDGEAAGSTDILDELARRINKFKEKGLTASICSKARGIILKHPLTSRMTFSSADMCKKFKSQFYTERRVSAKDGLLYPINIIATVINKYGTKGSISLFFDKVIGGMKVIVSEKGDTLPFGEVGSLSIEKRDGNGIGQLVATLKGGRKGNTSCKVVYTETVSDTGEKQYVPLRISCTSQINRDHDEPIANILAGLNAEEYPYLSRMTEAYRSGKSKKSQDVQERLAAMLGGQITSEYADGLFKEIKRLFTFLHFTLMEEHENKKKSNK